MSDEKRGEHDSGTVSEAVQGNEFTSFAFEDAADDKVLKASLWGAVGLHIVLLLINFPALGGTPRAVEKKPKKIFVVKPIRFEVHKDPPVEPLKKLTRKVPVPDPSPDDPEPFPVADPPIEVTLPDVDDFPLTIPSSPPPAEEVTGPIEVGGEVGRPVAIHAPQPRYTEIARRVRTQGHVIVKATIDREGNVVNAEILKGLPMGLSEETIKTVKTWKFKPATLRGKPVSVYYRLTVHFKLQ